ncbi:Pleiotropic regulatory protein [uncultured Paludibacter sp.]|uniref:Pleiotropic regulatory protein n=1 Tax=uncultured Paludibacter sp. TaxID=497635 RepID=A0A653A624_9BACT|nr:Pleiotropic regulatory protein [uncultured Paludibacter sp.]
MRLNFYWKKNNLYLKSPNTKITTMKPIQMVDLKSQYEKIKTEINAGIQEVIDSAAFIKGGKVNVFQKNLEKYLGVKHVIPVGNGTDALQIALMALDLKPGDEVITPTFTFIATAEVVALLGLTPVVVDVEPDTFNISIKSLRKAITPKTKAIVPVHLFGQNADMEEILEIAKEHHLAVIEDACQSIGSVYTFSDGKKVHSGCMGDIGCTSFFPSKNLGCYGDGGAIFTNNDELAAKMRAVANHGMVVRYYHDFVGVNSRLDSMQAAVLDVKLKYLDDYIAARQRAAAFYDNAFADTAKITIPVRTKQSTHVFHQYTVKLNGVGRETLQKQLAEKGIPAMIYYPVPLHLQKAYTDARYKEGDFPNAEMLCNCVLSLPMHTELDEEQLKYITENILELVK